MSDDVFDVEFMAPIPSGRAIYVAEVRSSADEALRARLVLDRDAKMLYCDPILWGPLHREPRAVDDPIAVLRQFTWRVVSERLATVLGTVISSQRTRLFLGPRPTTAYR